MFIGPSAGTQEPKRLCQFEIAITSPSERFIPRLYVQDDDPFPECLSIYHALGTMTITLTSSVVMHMKGFIA
jgi:hypothetical protein